MNSSEVTDEKAAWQSSGKWEKQL